VVGYAPEQVPLILVEAAAAARGGEAQPGARRAGVPATPNAPKPGISTGDIYPVPRAPACAGSATTSC
jgi:hypothetical protein